MPEQKSQEKIVIVKPHIGYTILVGVLSAIATSYVLKFAKDKEIPILSGPKEEDDDY